jgi:hypothetical protein
VDIFCERCQLKVGRIPDEKIPVGKKLSVNCPICGEKIHFAKPVELSADFDILDDESVFRSGTTGAEPGAPSPAASSAEASFGYDFSIMAIIREAWAKTSGIKGPIWGAGALAFLAMIIVSAVATSIAAIIGGGAVANALAVAVQLTVSVALYPFMAGLVLIGIRRAGGLRFDFMMVFSCFTYILPIVIASLLVSILSSIGFMLLILPGIYLSVAYLMVIPLIIDKEMGPWQAMETSRKAVQHHWFKVFGLYALMTIIFIFSVIPFGLGLIWTFPMFIMVGGILYREIFGVSQAI